MWGGAMPTNFDLAPPGKTVDGLAAVPIDIQHIIATLMFDGATSSGTGDATIDFVVGPGGGCPIFDLRQTITAAWLDGAPLLLADVALHDFGGGAGPSCVSSTPSSPPDSSHTLRLDLHARHAAGVDRRQLSAGDGLERRPAARVQLRLHRPGPRALSRGVDPSEPDLRSVRSHRRRPGDQHRRSRTRRSPTARSPSLGTNHWSIAFPARFTALSPLLEVRASDTSLRRPERHAAGVRRHVTIEAWKLTSSATDLAARIADIAGFLTANETSTGPYVHGNRFVAFLNVGGMEYEGGTTASVGSLRHETFHSWWGRGVKPAGRRTAGGTRPGPSTTTTARRIDAVQLHEPAVELSPRNPWTRLTPARRTRAASASSRARPRS